MNIFKNKEVKKDLLIFLGFSSLLIVISFLWNIYFGVFTLLTSLGFCIIFIFSLKRRYKRIEKLSDDINRIMHGDESINLQQYSEGEISILESEIYKMTVKIKEQRRRLNSDKIFLADSLADISHQLRTPLTSANILICLLSEPKLSDEERLQNANKLLSTLTRMDWLIVTLLKISKLDAGTIEMKKEEIELKLLIEKAAEHILIPMEIKEQSLKIDANGFFKGDLLWSVEAISNILKNCMEHTGKGGVIEVFAQENPIYSEIIIKDSGSGFSKKDLTHLFDRFYKGENSDEQSFGIGLSLSKTIINSQNGTIKAKNAPKGGAEFIIKFYK